MSGFALLALASGLAIPADCSPQLRPAAPQPYRIEVAAGADLLAVRDRVRALPASNRVHGVEIVLADGDYRLPRGLGLGAADSGSADAPVVWKAKTPGKAVLRADLRVPADAFRPVTDPKTLARLPDEARGKVFVADLSKLHPGSFPAVKNEFEGAPPPPVVLVDGKFGTLARWPNAPKSAHPKPDEGFASYRTAVDRGTKSKWTDDGRTYYEGGAFVFDNPRAKRWHFDEGVWMSGYWSFDWNFPTIRAASFGTENGTNNVLRMIGATPYPYGVLNYRTGRYGRRFFVFNLLDEIDEPGEWWLDRARKLLYLYPTAGRITPATDVSLLLRPAETMSGTGLKNARFEGLVFERNYWTLVHFEKAADVTFSNCTFRFSALDGLVLNGDRLRVTGCTFRELGRDGINVKGGDRRTLARSDNLVEACSISRFGCIQKTYSGGIKAKGVGMTIRGNEIFNAPHTGIFYETNDSLIESNDIHHVMLEAEDAGAIYTGRDLTTQGNVIRGNFIHECADWTSLDGDSTMGIYFDDRDAGDTVCDTVCDNVFWRLSIGVHINGGRDHPITNNVFCECRRAVSIAFSGIRPAERRKKAGKRDPLIEKAEKLGFRDEPWKSRYPRLAAIESEEPDLPLGNDVVGNVIIDSDDDLLRIGDLNVEKAVSNEVHKLVVRDNAVHATSPKFKTQHARPALRGGFRAARPDEVERSLRKIRRTPNASAPWDVVIYGGTPAAISAAIQAKRMGARAVVVSPDKRIGGLTTGGLGQTDIGNKSAFGGLALDFYRDVAKYYDDPANWKWQAKNDFRHVEQGVAVTAGSMWVFEPSAALKILEGWERREGLDIRRGQRLNRGPSGVKVEGGRIVSFATEDGTVYRGKVFVDATYEGDLLAAAGVSYAVGREANAQYGETISGIERREAKWHQFREGVDPYVVCGDPSSGLLPNVEPYDPKEKDGDGDRRIQAYCFRMCLTDVPENRIPFAKPANYRELDYELLLRNFEKAPADAFDGDLTWKLPWINSKMPNRKTDTNNRDAFSTDFIGRNWRWPEASYAERDRILKEHLDYQRGLMWTLANHPRVPAKVRAEVSKWGTCRDEFADGLGDGWQTQLYVREARRLVGEYVMTEHECRGDRTVPHPVAMGAYGMDSHHVRRTVGPDGFVRNEGDVEDHLDTSRHSPKWNPKRAAKLRPYSIDYGALVPKRAECANLLVPVCVSASHMAFGSIRMEPVFFALGQVAGTAAAMSCAADCAVQDVDYPKLAARLVADGQVISRCAADASAPVHAPSFFWLWNDRLDVATLCAQLDVMKANGLDAVCIHPLPKTFRADIASSMEPDYLTPDFLDVYAQVVAHAARLGMHAYLYDEGGWPSGSACGQVAASDPEGRFRLRWMRLDAGGRPELFTQPYAGTAPRTAIAEKGLAERFISLTHARYASVLGDRLGRSVKIAFTDEPDMPRSVPGRSLGWTADFADVFRARKGYDILPHVPDLIRRYDESDDRLARVRIDYHDVMADLMVERYLRPLQVWCRSHGLLSGGHFNAEDDVVMTPELGFGSLMRSLRALDVPGVDVIWRQLFPETPSQPARTGVFPRFASSAAHLNGTEIALSETFAIFGDSLTPAQARWLVDYQLVRGINTFVFAAFAQSNAGRQMIQYAPHGGPVAPSWPMQKTFFTSVRRLSEFLAKGRPGAETAVLYDVRGLWAGGADRLVAVANLESAARTLEAMNCDFDFVDDDLLATATVLPDGRLRVGAMTYRTLVLPTSKWLLPAARKVCDGFRNSCGRVVGMDGLASVPRTLSVFGVDSRRIRVMKRIDGNRAIYAVMNEGKDRAACRLRFPEKGGVVRYRPERDALEGVSASNETDRVFAPGELQVFVSGDVPACAPVAEPRGPTVRLEGGWTLRKEIAHVAGKTDFILATCTEPAVSASLGDWRGRLGAQFSGRAVYRTVFTSATAGKAVLDLGTVRWSAAARLNGRDLGSKFSGPFRWDVEVGRGTNVLEVTVANLLANQLGSDEVRARLGRDFPPIGPYEARLSSFDRENHESGLFGPVTLRFDR